MLSMLIYDIGNFLLTYELGRFVGAEVELYGVKSILLGIYAPNEDKVKFYKRLIGKLITFIMKIGVWWGTKIKIK